MATSSSKSKQHTDAQVTSDDKTSNVQDSYLMFREFGVWTVMQQMSSNPGSLWFRGFQGYVHRFHAAVPLMWRLIRECYQTSPRLMIIYLISSFLSEMKTSVHLYFSNHLLNCIQNLITKESTDPSALFIAAAYVIDTFHASGSALPS
ncbi:hypothetical protein M422DRAFT_54813 [Sphaerobolus stellatus SS14]|uniref:Uncharacterized protein n=1 Tax=Sphaerobolus stellatus (strain SS14) TaxID=990650 RepID=A0A0C9UG77_SPHS4|nr:hypothetical protein M422DRAFT_54813 [Sphaerobolus stellatus SS14]